MRRREGRREGEEGRWERRIRAEGGGEARYVSRLVCQEGRRRCLKSRGRKEEDLLDRQRLRTEGGVFSFFFFSFIQWMATRRVHLLVPLREDNEDESCDEDETSFDQVRLF